MELMLFSPLRLALVAKDSEDSSTHANDNSNGAEEADGESESCGAEPP